MKKVEVTIESEETTQTLQVRRGLGFQAIDRLHETPIEFDCREADCGICIIELKKGLENLSPMTDAEQDFLKAMRADPNERLACQCRIFGPAEIHVPT